jgi:hypothetical protein
MQADVRFGQDGDRRQSVSFTKLVSLDPEQGRTASPCHVGQQRSHLGFFEWPVRTADVHDRMSSQAPHGLELPAGRENVDISVS